MDMIHNGPGLGERIRLLPQEREPTEKSAKQQTAIAENQAVAILETLVSTGGRIR
jgi:hypothetical protein